MTFCEIMGDEVEDVNYIVYYETFLECYNPFPLFRALFVSWVTLL